MRNLQVQKLKNLKLNNEIQYKMESIINEMVIDVMDVDLNDDKSMLNLFYNTYNNISNDFIQACRDKYFNSIMVQDELKKYINSYRSNVLKLEVPRGIVDRINSPTDKINFMILVSIDIFIHLNQQLILDSFRSLYSNINLK